MRYCSRCVLPDTKPGIWLDAEGVCSACRSNEEKKSIDWETRRSELARLADEIRGSNGNGYDCIVPVSSGKDSFYQTWMMKVVQRLHVLCVVVIPHLQTREGISNLNALVSNLHVDLVKVSVKPGTLRILRRRAFFEIGEPNWAEHCAVFAGVARVAYAYRVPLVVWGEDIAVEFGGSTSNKRVASAEDLIENDLIKKRALGDFFSEDVAEGDVYFYRHPPKDELKRRQLRSIYLGYYDCWDGHRHYEVAKELGFQERSSPLAGNILTYDNIDEKLCEINIWFKFLKFGFWRPTDQCCYQIWNARMTREEAVEIVNARQYEFPGEYLKEFLEYHEITEAQFWETVEWFRNPVIWHKLDGRWRLKVPLV